MSQSQDSSSTFAQQLSDDDDDNQGETFSNRLNLREYDNNSFYSLIRLIHENLNFKQLIFIKIG